MAKIKERDYMDYLMRNKDKFAIPKVEAPKPIKPIKLINPLLKKPYILAPLKPEQVDYSQQNSVKPITAITAPTFNLKPTIKPKAQETLTAYKPKYNANDLTPERLTQARELVSKAQTGTLTQDEKNVAKQLTNLRSIPALNSAKDNADYYAKAGLSEKEYKDLIQSLDLINNPIGAGAAKAVQSLPFTSKLDINSDKVIAKQHPTASLVGTLSGEALQYMALGAVTGGIGSIVKGTSTFAKLATKAPKFAKFISNPVTERLIANQIQDTAIQAPKIISQGLEQGKSEQAIVNDLLKQQGLSLGTGLVFEGAGKAFKMLVQKAKAGKAVTQAEVENAIVENITENEIKQAVKVKVIPVNNPFIKSFKKEAATGQQSVNNPFKPISINTVLKKPIINATYAKNTTGLNFISSKNVTPEVKALISTDEKAILHEVYGDKKAIAESKRFIEQNGINEASAGQLIKAYQLGKATKADTAASIEIYNGLMLSNSPTAPQVAAELMAEMTLDSVKHAQGLQAYTLINKMTPAGYAKMIENQINHVNRELEKKFGNTKYNLLAPKDDPFLQELLNKRANTNSVDARDLVGGEIESHIKSQIKSNNLEKLTAVAHLFMLANLRTHLKNIGGNTILAGVNAVSDAIATGIEKLLPKEMRTKTMFWKQRASQELKDEVAAETQKFGKSGMNGNKLETGTLNNNSNVFSGGLKTQNILLQKVAKGIDIGIGANYKLLGWEDSIFGKFHFSNALGQYMSARGLTTATKEALMHAKEQALILTFRDASKVATRIMQLQKDSKLAYALIEMVLPFKLTPINIAKRSVELSPFGLIKGAVNTSKALYNISKGIENKLSPSEAINQLAKGVTGSTIIGLAFLAASKGLLTGISSKDKDQAAFDKATGKQPFSVKIGDGYYTYDWAAPTGALVAAGVSMYEATKKSEAQGGLFNLSDAAGAGIDSMFNMSVWKNVAQSVNGTYGSSIWDNIKGSAQDYAKRYIPSIVNTVSQSLDENIRNTYYEPNKFVADLQAKTPFSNKLQPLIGIKGKPLMRSANPLIRALQVGVFPWSSSTGTFNSTDREIERVYKATRKTFVFPHIADKKPPVLGKDYTLTPAQATNWQKTLGTTTYQYLSDTFKNPLYQTLSDEDKAKAIQKIIEFSNQTAKLEFAKSIGIAE